MRDCGYSPSSARNPLTKPRARALPPPGRLSPCWPERNRTLQSTRDAVEARGFQRILDQNPTSAVRDPARSPDPARRPPFGERNGEGGVIGGMTAQKSGMQDFATVSGQRPSRRTMALHSSLLPLLRSSWVAPGLSLIGRRAL